MSDFINRLQIEVLSAADADRRRYWSDDGKLRIVEESFTGHRQAAGGGSHSAASWHLPLTADNLAAAVSKR